MTCDAEAECTCSKCNSTDIECQEKIGECDMPSESGATSMTFIAAMVITLASAVMML
jgi:hypothetical protein